MKGQVIFRGASFSLIFSVRATLGLLLLTLLLLASTVISLRVGNEVFGWTDTFLGVLGEADAFTNLIVQNLRLPRILLAIIAGASLAIAGLLLQNLTRVSLASPSLLGTVDGAGFMVTLFLWWFSDASNQLVVSIHWLPFVAFLGAVMSLTLLFALVRRKSSMFRLILLGIALSGLFKALTILAMIKGPISVASQAQLWLVGYVNQTSWSEIQVLAPIFISLMVLVIAAYRLLLVSNLHQDTIAGLGLSINRQTLVLALLSTAFTATAVAFAGGIGFVGLVVPHLARRLFGAHALVLLFSCAVMGALMVLLADLAGRTLFSPYEVPTGVFTALIGIPFFLYLYLFKGR